MNYYRVGGCVRDRLLGLDVNDIDWVVTGATPGEMLDAGFKGVGRDFPVFLHPETGEEYALARSERKTGPGYRGFEVSFEPDTTIEQDLLRRDLTINAMAETENGEVIDPYGGRRDLEARILRHVSPAFVEDPVRVLRVARFAARFSPQGFRVADETRELIRQIGESGELAALVAERVWQELSRALDEPDPAAFFETLRDCGVLGHLFPEIEALHGVPQTARYHPEVDTGVHLMMALRKSAELGHDNETRFAVLMHDLGKGTTPSELLPRHHGHERRGVDLVRAFCQRWRVPRSYRDLALLTTEYHTQVHRAFDLKPATLLKMLRAADAFRKPERLKKMLAACVADLRGRLQFENAEYPQADFIAALADSLRALDHSHLQQQGLQGKALGEAIRRERLALIARARASAVE